jgi:hypothetical protein
LQATALPDPFKLELKNNSERDLIALQYNTFGGGGFLALKWLSQWRNNPELSKRWVERTKSKYERWWAAAENMTSH